MIQQKIGFMVSPSFPSLALNGHVSEIFLHSLLLEEWKDGGMGGGSSSPILPLFHPHFHAKSVNIFSREFETCPKCVNLMSVAGMSMMVSVMSAAMSEMLL